MLRQFYNCESLVKLLIDESNIKDFLYDSTQLIPLKNVEEKTMKDFLGSRKSNLSEKIIGELNVLNMSQSILHLQAGK
jgi:hypothetical protein